MGDGMKCAACGYEGDGFIDIVGRSPLSVYRSLTLNVLTVAHDGKGSRNAELVACPACKTVKVKIDD